MKARRVATQQVFYGRTNVNRAVNLEGRKA